MLQQIIIEAKIYNLIDSCDAIEEFKEGLSYSFDIPLECLEEAISIKGIIERIKDLFSRTEDVEKRKHIELILQKLAEIPKTTKTTHGERNGEKIFIPRHSPSSYGGIVTADDESPEDDDLFKAKPQFA
jgi:hypothetical protein